MGSLVGNLAARPTSCISGFVEGFNPAFAQSYPGLPFENDSFNLEQNIEHCAIRTVLLLPGPSERNDEIECLLQNATIRKSKGKYRALSYHWGDSNHRRVIRLNGQRFEVTENLWQALRHLRHKREQGVFWIDALCIDQANIEERNSQVRYMWAIYRHALETMVFLGEETESTGPSMGWIRRVVESLIGERSGNSSVATDFITHNSAEFDTLTGKVNRLEEAVGDLMKRPWWRRVWVVQEVAVAQHVTVMWGTKTLSWTYFDVLIDTYVSYFLGRTVDIPFLLTTSFLWDAASAIQTARSRYQGLHRDHGLAALLIRFRGFESTDPRDKVYGLLRLSRESASIIPDYTHTEAEVFKETVRSSIAQSRGLAILSAVNYSDRSLLLPSWCPDWSRGTPDNLPFFSREFRSAGESEAAARFSGEILTVRGIRVDKIAQLHIFPSETKILHTTELESLQAFFRSHDIQDSPYETEEARQAVLNKILRLNSLNHFDQMLMNLHKEHGYEHGTEEKTVEQVYIENYLQRMLEDPLLARRRIGLDFSEGEIPLINAKGRNLFVSEKGYLGLVPTAVVESDVLVVFFGGRVVFCIRPIEGQKTFELIGDCYMDGYMSGKAMDQAAAGELSEQDFDLV